MSNLNHSYKHTDGIVRQLLRSASLYLLRLLYSCSKLMYCLTRREISCACSVCNRVTRCCNKLPHFMSKNRAPSSERTFLVLITSANGQCCNVSCVFMSRKCTPPLFKARMCSCQCSGSPITRLTAKNELPNSGQLLNTWSTRCFALDTDKPAAWPQLVCTRANHWGGRGSRSPNTGFGKRNFTSFKLGVWAKSAALQICPVCKRNYKRSSKFDTCAAGRLLKPCHEPRLGADWGCLTLEEDPPGSRVPLGWTALQCREGWRRV